MATAHPLPAPPSEQTQNPGTAVAADVAEELALATSPHPVEEENPIPLNATVARLPVELDVAVPVRDFRVRNLLALEPGQVIESQWGNGDDVPLASGDVQLAWSEFEVVDTQLAVRVTRLA
jgi:flagellar motor switch protein FliN/FliY